MKQYATRDIMALDRAGEYYSRHVEALTHERLHDKCDIAAELAWRDFRIAQLERQVEQAKCDVAETVAEYQKVYRLRNAAKAVLRIWDDLYSNQGDPAEPADWETLRKVISET